MILVPDAYVKQIKYPNPLLSVSVIYCREFIGSGLHSQACIVSFKIHINYFTMLEYNL